MHVSMIRSYHETKNIGEIFCILYTKKFSYTVLLYQIFHREKRIDPLFI